MVFSLLRRIQDGHAISLQLIQVPKKQPVKAIEMYLTTVIGLKQNLTLLPPLGAKLQPCKTALLSTISSLLLNPCLDDLVNKIHLVINEEVAVHKNTLQMRNQVSLVLSVVVVRVCFVLFCFVVVFFFSFPLSLALSCRQIRREQPS